MATGAYVIFIITAIMLFFQKVSWANWLEINGVNFATAGALWTSLGVRLSKYEHKALLSMMHNTKFELNEIIKILKVASNFATQGAILIATGGIFLAIKMLHFHQ